MAMDSSVSFRSRIATQVDGVFFQGNAAFALVDDQSVRVDVTAGWKKAELRTILTRQGIPNNSDEISLR